MSTTQKTKTGNEWKIDRMAQIVDCNVYTLCLAVESYKALRSEGKSPKRAHTAVTKRYGWDMATWSQELVDLQSV